MIEHKSDVISIFECKNVLIIIINAKMPYKSCDLAQPKHCFGYQKEPSH